MPERVEILWDSRGRGASRGCWRGSGSFSWHMSWWCGGSSRRASGYCLGRVLQPPPSGLQGSLLISLQGGRNGRRREGCAWVCVQVRVRLAVRGGQERWVSKGARLHWGGRIPSGLVGNQRHWEVVSSAVLGAGKRKSWVGWFWALGQCPFL